LEEWTFDREKEESRCGVNAEFHAEKRGRGRQIDAVICAELFDAVNDEFLNQVSAISDAGDERGAGNCSSTEREPRTNRANKERGHADSDDWELPDTGGDGEVVSLAEVQRVSDKSERRQPKPRGAVDDALPPGRSKFLDRR